MADPFRAALHPLGNADARATYRRLFAASPQASVYSDLPFADAACEAFGFSGHLVLVTAEGDDTPRAGLVLFERTRGPLRAAALPPAAEYVTPLLATWPGEADLHARGSALDRLLALVAERTDQASFRLHPSVTDVRPFQWAGWTVTPAYQYEAPLPSGEAPESVWRRYPRKTLRKHRDAYLVEKGREYVGAVIALAEQSLGRKGMAAPSEALHLLADALMVAGQAEAFVALTAESGTPEAGIIAAFDDTDRPDPAGYYWTVGSVPGPAMTVLVGHVAEALRSRGCTRLVFGGANVPSVAEFKRGFGSALVPCYRARRVGHPALRLLDRFRT